MMKRFEPGVAFAPMIAIVIFALSVVSKPTVRAAQDKKSATPPAATAKSTAASAELGNAERGRELYVKNGCYECHGYDGQGGSYTGPRIAPDPLPWDALAAFLRNPPNLNSPATKDSAMPPYISKLVPDRDVQDIYAYLKSIPPATDIKNIPSYKK